MGIKKCIHRHICLILLLKFIVEMKRIFFYPAFLGAFLFISSSCNQTGKQLTPPVSHEGNDSIQTFLPHEAIDSMIPIADNSRLSIDWAGTYRGVLPCADCEGIKTELVLDESGTFRLGMLYMGKGKSGPVIREGRFEWDKTGNKIMLKEVAEGEGPRHFQVGEEKVFQLDLKGNRITGELAEEYVLSKYYPDTILEDKYWKLIELQGRKIGKMLKTPYIIILNEKVKGNGGCNTFSGSVKITQPNKIFFQDLISTKMACVDQDGNRTESLFFDALNKADQFIIRNDTLTLTKGRMAPLAKFVFDFFGE